MAVCNAITQQSVAGCLLKANDIRPWIPGVVVASAQAIQLIPPLVDVLKGLFERLSSVTITVSIFLAPAISSNEISEEPANPDLKLLGRNQ